MPSEKLLLKLFVNTGGRDKVFIVSVEPGIGFMNQKSLSEQAHDQGDWCQDYVVDNSGDDFKNDIADKGWYDQGSSEYRIEKSGFEKNEQQNQSLCRKDNDPP